MTHGHCFGSGHSTLVLCVGSKKCDGTPHGSREFGISKVLCDVMFSLSAGVMY